MEWNGAKIKDLAKSRSLNQQNIADELEVTRQTVSDWIKGHVPKGLHLIKLCKLFEVKPDYFFLVAEENGISLPLHRKRQNAKITQEVQKEAYELAKEYAVIFKNEKISRLLPVMRGSEKSDTNAKNIAHKLRRLSGVSDNAVIDHKNIFALIEKLGINLIIKKFPENIKAYAFYINIHGHRVIFLNSITNLLDLNFALLNETVHAIRDEVEIDRCYEEEEESFCDSVANHIQFPESYIELVYNTIKGLGPAIKVNKLKEFGKQYKHSLYGIVKNIQSYHQSFKLNIGGADVNLKKMIPTIGEAFLNTNDSREYVDRLKTISPVYINIIKHQIDDISDRKLEELLGLESLLDAKAVKEELLISESY